VTIFDKVVIFFTVQHCSQRWSGLRYCFAQTIVLIIK